MAWSDEPTPAQIGTIYRWIEWKMTNLEAKKAMQWLRQHATRKEVSDEMTRIRNLKNEHKLTKEECFNSEVWADYDPDKFEYVPPKEYKLVVDNGK